MKKKMLLGFILSAVLLAVPAFAVRTVITVQAPAQFGGIQNAALTAADSANGMMFPNDGKTVFVILNNDAAAKTVTIVSVPDENGRSGDIILVVPAAAGGFPGVAITDTLPPALFSQQNGDAGNVYVNFSASTSVKVAAIRIP